MQRMTFSLVAVATLFLMWSIGDAQEKSVKPGINDSFRNPDVKEFIGRFEIESREVFQHRQAILTACQIQPGQTVADIGAGTGLFTRLFSDAVGSDGRVIAVDIAQNFLDHILKTSREAGKTNVETQLGTADSTELPANSVDVAFICDTYHHFEFPLRTMTSLYHALKPGGRVILIDFRREEGQASDWVMSHVRASQDVFESEILRVGFRKDREERDLLKDNYFVVFKKPALDFPIIEQHGGALSRPQAAEPPRSGAKVVFDVTATSEPAEIHKGLDRVARLLNLYGSAGLKASDVEIAIVFHGNATTAVLNDSFYKQRQGVDQNPNLPLIKTLQEHGVKVFVCGQALNYKGIADGEVAENIPIAAAALTVVINKQSDGYAYVPVP